jgi:hypothetical protein
LSACVRRFIKFKAAGKWTVEIFASAFAAEPGWSSDRAVSDEPQYIIMNFGISQ